MSISLSQILNLVGKVDDSPGIETPRERFRKFLTENINDIGQVRDYIEECLRNTGDQYHRALQDLVNYLGNFLGFQVKYGRYQGVKGDIGFDGLWLSKNHFNFIIEVKTTEVYTVKTSTLIGYIDQMISEKIIPSWDKALGLYVIGKPDPDVHNLENSINAEKRNQQLRIISVEALLSLAEMMNEYDVNHEDILAFLLPSGPTIDPIVTLMSRLVAQKTTETIEKEDEIEISNEVVNYWLTPVKADENRTAEDVIKILVGQEKIYAFGERTPGRKHIKPGDWICFYATTNGIVAHAQVDSYPEKMSHPKVKNPDKYPWVFHLKNTNLYLDKPVILDELLRSKLSAFKNRDLKRSWAWFVQATSRINKDDFNILTRR